MLNVSVSEIVLDQSRVRALIGKGEAASVAQHMRMGGQGQPRQLAIIANDQPYGLAAERPAQLSDKESVRLRLYLPALRQP